MFLSLTVNSKPPHHILSSRRFMDIPTTHKSEGREWEGGCIPHHCQCLAIKGHQLNGLTLCYSLGGLKRNARAVRARAAIWASRPTRNPHFVVLGASLLFDNTYFGACFASDMAFLGSHPFPPIFTYFHSPHVLLSMLISPHYGCPQCGHSASASLDLHPTSDAIVKVKINMR